MKIFDTRRYKIEVSDVCQVWASWSQVKKGEKLNILDRCRID